MNGPTIYRTLMDDAMKEARRDRYGLTLDGLDDVIAQSVSPAERQRVEAAVEQAFARAYQRGLEHGYVQAVAAVEGRS